MLKCLKYKEWAHFNVYFNVFGGECLVIRREKLNQRKVGGKGENQVEHVSRFRLRSQIASGGDLTVEGAA